MTDIVQIAARRMRHGRPLDADRLRGLWHRITGYQPADADRLRRWATPLALIGGLIGTFTAWGPWAAWFPLARVGLALLVAGPLSLLVVLTLVPSNLELEALNPVR